MELYEAEEYIHYQIPIRILKHFLDGEKVYSPLHWHRSIEIDLAIEGKIELKVDGKSKKMKKGNWNIINSGELHSFTCIERGDSYVGFTVLISKSFLDTWLEKDVYLVYPENVTGQNYIRNVLKKFVEIEENHSKFYKVELMETLFLFVRLLGEYCIIEKQENRYQQPKRINNINNIKSIINYIDEHYKENISLKNVAAKFNYSPPYVSRLFKEHIGYNFYEYLQDVRLLNAVEQLKKSQDMLLIDCALENGFPNVKSFITTFKKMYNCTPSEWRKNTLLLNDRQK